MLLFAVTWPSGGTKYRNSHIFCVCVGVYFLIQWALITDQKGTDPAGQMLSLACCVCVCSCIVVCAWSRGWTDVWCWTAAHPAAALQKIPYNVPDLWYMCSWFCAVFVHLVVRVCVYKSSRAHANSSKSSFDNTYRSPLNSVSCRHNSFISSSVIFCHLLSLIPWCFATVFSSSQKRTLIGLVQLPPILH